MHNENVNNLGKVFLKNMLANCLLLANHETGIRGFIYSGRGTRHALPETSLREYPLKFGR